jgi:methionyl aminopeptidase
VSIRINTPVEVAAMRESGRILASVLEYLRTKVEPGMTTDDLDRLAVEETAKLGGEPAFKGHEGFTKSLCTSVNDAVVHGIPSDFMIHEGDIIGLDYGIRYQGMITDSAITIPVGEIAAPAQRLLKATEAAMYVGIDQAVAGNHVGDVSSAIQKHLQAAGLSVIEELAGHGVGRELWEEPNIPNIGRPGMGPIFKPGMTVAIEPMATLASPAIELLPDNWTIVTRDGSLAAQFEHTVLITNGAPEILTQT